MVAQIVLTGHSRLKSANYKATRTWYSRAISLHPRSRMDPLSQGIDNLNRGRYDEAIADFNSVLSRSILARSLEDAYALVYRAEALSLKGELDAALSDINRALEINPDLPMAYKIRASVNWERGDLMRAVEDITFVIDHDPDDEQSYYFRASVRMHLDQYSSAIEDLTSLLIRDPFDTQAYYARSQCHWEMNQLNFALEDLDGALEIQPQDVSSLTFRGAIRYELDEWDAAKADIDRALEIDPSNVFTRFHRGLLRKETGDEPGAREDLNAFLESDVEACQVPRYDQWVEFSNRSLALCTLGCERESLELLNNSLKEWPELKDLLNQKAWLLATSPDSTIRDGMAAVELATLACEKSHWSRSECIGTLSAAYAEIGNFEKALASLDQAVSIDKRYKRERSTMREAFLRGEPYRSRPLSIPGATDQG